MHWYTICILSGFCLAIVGWIIYFYQRRKILIKDEPIITNLMEYEPPVLDL